MNEAIERIYKLTVQADEAVRQLKNVAGSADNIQKQFDALGRTLKTVFAGVSVATVIQAFRSITEEADKIGKASEKFGVATEALQTLGYAAGQSGVDFDSLAKGMQNLNKNLVDVENGTNDAAKALRALGVTGADSPEEAFRKIAEGLASIPDGAEKTAAALAIFSKAGADLIPLLNEGGKGIAALEERARALGVVMDGEAIEAATRFNDALDDMGVAARGIIRQISVGLLPAISSLADEMAGAAKASDDWQSFGRGLATVLKALAVVAVNVAYVFNAVGREIGAIAAQAVALATLDFAGAAAIGRAVTEDAEKAKANVDALTERIWNLNTGFETTATTLDTKTNPALQRTLKTALATQDAGAKSKTEKTPLQQFIESALKAQQEADLLLPKIEELDNLFFNKKITEPVWTKLRDSLLGVADAGEQAVDPMKEFSQSLLDQQAAIDRMPDQLAVIEKLYKDGAISADLYADALKGIGINIDTISDKKAVDGVKEMNQAIANGLQQGVSGLVDMIFEADQSWEEFAANFLKSIAKMLTQMALLNMLKSSSTFGSFFASAHGNAFSGATGLPQGVYPAGHPVYFPMGSGNAPLNKFAHGGTIGVLAEGSNAEAIVPLMRHGGDLGVKASPVNIVVNNTMADNAKVEVAETNKPDGSKEIQFTIRRVMQSAFSDGSMDATMRGNYGMQRAAVR